MNNTNIDNNNNDNLNNNISMYASILIIGISVIKFGIYYFMKKKNKKEYERTNMDIINNFDKIYNLLYDNKKIIPSMNNILETEQNKIELNF